MSFESRFSEQEQLLLTSLPTLTGSVMSMAEGSGLGTINELLSSAKTMVTATKEFPNNEIISAVAPNVENREQAMEKARSLKEKIRDYLKTYEIKSKEELRTHVLDDCRKANELMNQKAEPKEAEQYKSWVLNVAENVANAAKEGGFLGFGGKKVSENESVLFNQLAEALHSDRRLN